MRPLRGGGAAGRRIRPSKSAVPSRLSRERRPQLRLVARSHTALT